MRSMVIGSSFTAGHLGRSTRRHWSELGLRALHTVHSSVSFVFLIGWGIGICLPIVAAPGLIYTNYVVGTEPWSIHVVQVPRGDARYEIHSVHANGNALGLSTLTAQIAALEPRLGTPVAAINGDFYQRDKAYAGAPRGFQVMRGEILSAPSGKAAFWVDAMSDPHVTHVKSRFQVSWPDGRMSAFGLNGERPTNGCVLYTPAIGKSTHTKGGLELVLKRRLDSRWLPLRVGQSYWSRVDEVRPAGNTPMNPDVLVLSLGPAIQQQFQSVRAGDLLHLTLACDPPLRGIKTALGGGPVLVREGRAQRIRSAPDDAYELSSMLERHPRSAIGWNKDWFFLVEVDGRQRDLSVGMTLEELATYLVSLGCKEALNLDGGGSSILWHGGAIRSSPCDGYERTMANGLVVLQKRLAPPSISQTASPTVNQDEPPGN